MFTDTGPYRDLVMGAIPVMPSAIEETSADEMLSEYLHTRVCLATARRVTRKYDAATGVPWENFVGSCMKTDLRKQIESGITETDEEGVLDILYPNGDEQ